MSDQFRALSLFYWNPRKAASAVLDHGRLLFAVAAAALIATVISIAAGKVQSLERDSLLQAVQAHLFQADPQATPPEVFHLASQSANQLIGRRYFAIGYQPLVILAVLFVPFTLLILAVWDHLGSGLTVLFRDYSPALAGLLFAWTAAHIPIAILWLTPLAVSAPGSSAVVLLQLAGILYFLVLAAIVLATVTGASVPHAGVASVVALAASALASLLFARSSGLFYMLASPWLLFYGYRMFGGDIQSLGGGLAQRQNFKRQLEIATINPRDADAHFQLGLIYAQRRLAAEAESSFRRALEIDPDEPDYLFHLGRLLRQQVGRAAEARPLLEKGAELNPKLASHEVWRELGAVELAEGRLDIATRYMEHYIAAREYDPEGLVIFGQVLRAANRTAEARSMFERAIESVSAAPKFRRAEVSRWAGIARQEMRNL